MKTVVIGLFLFLILESAYYVSEKNLALQKISELETENFELNTERSTYTKLGRVPLSTTYTDTNLHIYFFYGCRSCAEHAKRKIPVWTRNISNISRILKIHLVSFATTEGFNLLRELYPSIEEVYLTDPTIVVTRYGLSLVFNEYSTDDEISNGIKFLAEASQEEIESFKKPGIEMEKPLLGLTYLDVGLLGFVSGFNPCLIALLAFIVSTTTQISKNYFKAAVRVLCVSLGVFYAYLIFGFLTLSIPGLSNYVSGILLLVIAIFGFIGILHIADVIVDLWTGKWRRGEESSFLLFKTPKPIKNLISKSVTYENHMVDFGLGFLFSLVKLPCIGPIYLLLIFDTIREETRALSMLVTYNLGIVLPLVLIGVFLGVGIIKASQLASMRFKGRIIQRLVTGAALLVMTFVMIYSLHPF